MLVPTSFATVFTRTLDLFRDANAKEDQKVQFRALIALLKEEGVTMAVSDGTVTVNGTAVEGAYASLVQRLDLHSVREIVIPRAPQASQLFDLLKALADPPGDDSLATRLGTGGVSVTLQKLDLGTDGILHGEDVAPLHQAPPPPPPPEPPPLAEPVSPFGPSVAASRSAAETATDLEREPNSPHVSDLLAVIGRQLETAMRANRLEQAMHLVASVVRAEGKADETRRRQYSIALKRMYTKSLLEGIAQLVGAPGLRDGALLVLKRAGPDGVEVLLDLLVAAPTIEERRGIFAALAGMKEGADQLVHMLAHHQWFVVRNVAELVGELVMEEAVPALGRQLAHPDERVRKAVALALAKIGSRAAAEPLRRALKDPSADVRIQAAVGVGGRKASALAMPLVVAMGEEKDEAVEKELMLALGRIGSPDAVQALIKFAQPGGVLFGRKPTALRVTAVEALRVAATPAAIGTLEGLAADGDKQVKLAAQDALADLKKK